MTARFIVHQIAACPFSQRLEILLALKRATEAVEFRVADVTRPRAPELLAKTRGTTALPVLELPDGRVLKESLVILEYLDTVLPGRRIAQADPYRRAVEQMLVRFEGEFSNHGYAAVMNQDRSRRDALLDAVLKQHARLDAFLVQHAPRGPFLYDDFGWAEAVYTPLFMRFWFLDYYEDFDLPATADYARVRAWREACLAHPAAQQVTREQIVKLYHDYALGFGNGALPPGRSVSSFAAEPDWRARPWPPRGKGGPPASDAQLGLTPAG